MLGIFLLGIAHGRYSHLTAITMNLVQTQVSTSCLGWAKEISQLPHLLLHSHWHVQRNGGGAQDTPSFCSEQKQFSHWWVYG